MVVELLLFFAVSDGHCGVGVGSRVRGGVALFLLQLLLLLLPLLLLGALLLLLSLLLLLLFLERRGEFFVFSLLRS